MCDKATSIRRVMAILAGVTCAVSVAAGAQTRSAVQASAQVLAAPLAPDPATVSAWVREWRLSETGAPGVLPQVRRVPGKKLIESEIWSATLTERCAPSREGRCRVLVTVVFARN